jgi:hypothetical protein
VGSAGQPLSLSLKTSRRAVSSVSPSFLHAPACPQALENLFPACDQVKTTKMAFFLKLHHKIYWIWFFFSKEKASRPWLGRHARGIFPKNPRIY